MSITDDETRHNIRVLLREALNGFALDKDDQVSFNGPGCIACDLLESFDHAFNASQQWLNNELSLEQCDALAVIFNNISSLEAPDCECFNPAVLDRPRWGELRELARQALRLFGWEIVRDFRFEETEPGMWNRPPLDI